MKTLYVGVTALLAAGATCGTPTTPSPSIGEQLYRQHCYACHALEPDRNTAAGPTLHGVVGRPIAAERRFNYSPALRRLAERQERWTPDNLDRFLAGPEAMVPGTEMGIEGLSDAAERRVLIDWLATRAAASARNR